MNLDAGRWQAALLDDEVALFAEPRQQARLSVHRHSVRHALLGALQAAFPVLRTRLGEVAFAGLAVAFIRAHPPSSPVLHEYGAGLAGFIDAHSDALDSMSPWCADLARLEWARRAAFHAADSAPLSPADLRAIAVPALLQSRLILGASLHLLATPWPVFDLWQDPVMPRSVAEPEPQAIQIWRREDVVLVRRLGVGAHALISALRRGRRLLHALQAAQRAEPGFDAAAALTQLFDDRLIDGLATPSSPPRAST